MACSRLLTAPRVLLLLWALCTISAPRLTAQEYSGTFAAPNDVGGLITLVLREAGADRVVGRLSSNQGTYQLEGQVQEGLLVGTMRGFDGVFHFEAERAGHELWWSDYGIDAQGQPDGGEYTEIYFIEEGFDGARREVDDGVRGGNPLGGGWPAGGGNPLRSGKLDLYNGTFSDGNVTLHLQGGGGQYQGQVVVGGVAYPVQAEDVGNGLQGVIQSPDSTFPLTAHAQNGGLIVTSEGLQYNLMRQGPGGFPGGVGQPGGFAWGAGGVPPGLIGGRNLSRNGRRGLAWGFTEDHPRVLEWATLLSGQKITLISTFPGGNGGASDDRSELYLCPDRSFAMQGEAEVRGGRRSNFDTASGGRGEWYLITNGQVVVLILDFDNGQVQEFRMHYQDELIYANGQRVRMNPIEMCM